MFLPGPGPNLPPYPLNVVPVVVVAAVSKRLSIMGVG